MGRWSRIGGQGGSLWSGHASWHTSPGPWTSNCYCGMSIWLPRTVLKAQLQGRSRLSDSERTRLGEISHRLGRKALSEVATAALPDTIWHGIEDWSRANSTDHEHTDARADRQSTKTSRS